jgi:hypothetical protein
MWSRRGISCSESSHAVCPTRSRLTRISRPTLRRPQHSANQPRRRNVCNFIWSPGIEVLQTGPERLTCCLVLLPGRPLPLVFPGVRALLFPDCSQVRARRSSVTQRESAGPAPSCCTSRAGVARDDDDQAHHGACLGDTLLIGQRGRAVPRRDAARGTRPLSRSHG